MLLSLAGLLNIYPQRGAQGAGEVSEKTSYHSLPKPRSFQLEVFVQFYVFFFVLYRLSGNRVVKDSVHLCSSSV